MKIVFADTGYWIALLDPQDTLHAKAINLSITLAQGQICTSEMVLTEVLNHFSKRGSFLRAAAVALIESLQANPSIIIILQTDDIFQQGLALYKQRPDLEPHRLFLFLDYAATKHFRSISIRQTF